MPWAIPSHCTQETCDLQIPCREKQSKYILLNPSRRKVLLSKLDGCVDTGPDKACDYVILVPDRSVVCLVELKGCDLSKAAQQIMSTISRLPKEYLVGRIQARIVLSRVPAPDLRGSHYRSLQRVVAKRGGAVKQRTRCLEESVEEL